MAGACGRSPHWRVIDFRIYGADTAVPMRTKDDFLSTVELISSFNKAQWPTPAHSVPPIGLCSSLEFTHELRTLQ
jgi:hypothetical protein